MNKSRFLNTVLAFVVTLSLVATPSLILAADVETERVISPNYVDYMLLDIPTYKQEKTKWCWAASSQMVIEYLGGNKSQSQIVKYIKGSTINAGASDQEVIRVLDWAKISATRISGNLPFGKVISQISNNQPILAHINWKKDSELGHMVVIRGHYNHSETGKWDIYYKDPAQNAITNNVLAYDEFNDNSDFYWNSTIHSIYVK
ncbi:papain-like cysteine protease family protein [Paenibacillus massiliensis]|uniref:papain-like cysteine protease family protein n=1 Tax=Paenibacillus massiliensis TaxID=225917 RepID=UPI00035C3196|nr:papain-like cysteine protease family protein [Paenibacillus massiliensis]